MKRFVCGVGLSLALLAAATLSRVMVAQGGGEGVDVFSDGSDGPFEPAETLEVDLGLAVTGFWDSPSEVPGAGIYDPEKWAVVFKYSAVSIPAGVTVTFKNHPSRAPVVWLVDGDVSIEGMVDLSGASADPTLSDTGHRAEPGPGGFRGGSASTMGAGLGPGGAPPNIGANYAMHGSYGTSNLRTPATYGNEHILPLLGGSGGSSWRYGNKWLEGGAGGGAILIAARGTIALGGSILCRGGERSEERSGSGSGGAIRLIAESVAGEGRLIAPGGHAAGGGRIRVEANSVDLTDLGYPPYSLGVPGSPPLIWLPASAPSIRVTRVQTASGDVEVPVDLRASFEFGKGDVTLDTGDPVTLRIEATNVPTSWTVTVRLVPWLGEAENSPATLVEGNDVASVWSAEFTPRSGTSSIQVRAHE